jgi:hypothetical protein
MQQLSYDLIKEYSHLKIAKDEEFMKRMLFDVFKRQTKDDRLEKLIDRNKMKLNEEERIKTFNRLIEDANRRQEAMDNMDVMRVRLEEKENSDKRYTEEKWQDVYYER